MLSIPMWALMPFVVMISFVGIYSISHSTFDLQVMVGFGVLGFVLRKLEISVVPVVLGLLLGGEMESMLRRALAISGGDAGILVSSWISIGLYTITGCFLLIAVVLAMRKPRRPAAQPVADADYVGD